MPEQKAKPEVVQIPFRCDKKTAERLVRARGLYMSSTGETISNNEFFLRLLLKGLEDFEDHQDK